MAAVGEQFREFIPRALVDAMNVAIPVRSHGLVKQPMTIQSLTRPSAATVFTANAQWQVHWACMLSPQTTTRATLHS